MTKKNRVLRISLMGGIIGSLFTNPRKALEEEIDKANQQGWNAIHIQQHHTTNLLIWVLQLVVLILTLGLWTWGGGYLVLLEMEKRDDGRLTKVNPTNPDHFLDDLRAS